MQLNVETKMVLAKRKHQPIGSITTASRLHVAGLRRVRFAQLIERNERARVADDVLFHSHRLLMELVPVQLEPCSDTGPNL